MSRWEQISERIGAGEVIVIDGGMGSELQARGVEMNDAAWCALANLEAPGLVQAIHEDYIGAGAQVIIANTYPASRLMLSGAGMEDRFEDVNRRAVGAALAARDATGETDVAVAGSISLGVAVDFMGHAAAPSPTELHAAFREQADILAEAGVDLLALEMIMSPQYGIAAVEAALGTGLPVWLGVSVKTDDEGELVSLDGEIPVRDLLSDLLNPSLAAVTVMHSSVADTGPALDAVAAAFDGLRGAYPEAGDWTPPNWVFSALTPDEFAAEATAWAADGKAQMIGGCCGIGPPFVSALSGAKESGRLRRNR